MLKKALEGYNVSIVGFGTTGSGKTHLLCGTADDPGIIPMVSGGQLKLPYIGTRWFNQA